MRVIAGRLGGRHFESPAGHRTHPMSDKVRGALFNVLGDLSGLTVLDAFAGSGALGLEALSRGADQVVFIDNDRHAQRTIAANIKQLAVTKQAKLIQASIHAWLSTSSATFDVVLCDPPYDKPQQAVIQQVAKRVVPGGTLVVSLPPAIGLRLPAAYQLLAHKNYGDAELYFYRHEA